MAKKNKQTNKPILPTNAAMALTCEKGYTYSL